MTSKKVSQFFNRELSWLEFNYRVLEEALDETNPLLERLKFFTIFSSNLDEFFEVRVAGLKQQIESDVVERSSDGRTATETYLDVSRRVRGMLSLHRKCWKDQIHPNLEKSGIHFHQVSQLKKSDLNFVDDFFWLGLWQIHLIKNRYNLKSLGDRRVTVGHGLGFDTLRSVYN